MTKKFARVKDTHAVVRHAFCFWRLLFPFLASQLTTMSLDYYLSQDVAITV